MANSDHIPAKKLATAIRAHTLRMVHSANASHVGTCLSMADLLAVLYAGVLRVDHLRPDWTDRDRFILSKGHGPVAKASPRGADSAGLSQVGSHATG